MAKITITGQAVVVTSALKLEDIKTLKKYRPDALVLKGGEDGKEPVFMLAAGTMPEINQYGVCFTEESRNEDKLATLTIVTDYRGDKIEEHVADRYGIAIANLNKLEAVLPGVLEEVKAEREAIMDNITVVG